MLIRSRMVPPLRVTRREHLKQENNKISLFEPLSNTITFLMSKRLLSEQPNNKEQGILTALQHNRDQKHYK